MARKRTRKVAPKKQALLRRLSGLGLVVLALQGAATAAGSFATKKLAERYL